MGCTSSVVGEAADAPIFEAKPCADGLQLDGYSKFSKVKRVMPTEEAIKVYEGPVFEVQTAYYDRSSPRTKPHMFFTRIDLGSRMCVVKVASTTGLEGKVGSALHDHLTLLGASGDFRVAGSKGMDEAADELRAELLAGLDSASTATPSSVGSVAEFPEAAYSEA